MQARHAKLFAIGLIGTLILVVLVASAPDARIDEPAVSREAAGSADAVPPRLAVRDAPTVVTTPAQVREVVHATRAARSDEREDLRRLALTSSDPLVIGNAVRALGRLGEFANDPDLVALVDRDELRVRQESIRALGQSGDPSAVERLVAILDSEKTADRRLRPLIYEALGRLGGEQAEARLRAVGSSANASATDRVFAKQALSRL